MAKARLGNGARALLRGRWAAAAVWTLVGALAVGVMAVVGAGDGYSAEKPRLLSGAAWLPSSKAGQLALLDGSTAEVAAQVKVASASGDLDVVQQGSNAYVVNTAQGSVRRVNGATLAVSPAVTRSTPGARPVPEAGRGLRVFAGPGVLYTVDTEHGVLARTDPVTLARRGDLQPLAADAAAESTILDDRGALWALDVKTGDLNVIASGKRVTRRGAKAPGPGQLVLAGGSPVLVDLTGRSASLLDRESGTATSTVPLELRGGDEVAISGSPNRTRIYVVSRGVLTICDFGSTSCGRAISLGGSGQGFGAPVETGGRLFIPNYVTGRVWIVDLAGSKVVAKPEVLDPPTRFQLLTRDGVVFFNDPASERAGIIRLDGDVVKVPKYDPDNQNKGLTRQPDDHDDAHASKPPATRPGDPTASPDPTRSPNPTAAPNPTVVPNPGATNPTAPPNATLPPNTTGTPNPTQQPSGLPQTTPPTTPAGTATPATSPTPTPTPTDPPTVSIAQSKQTAKVNETVTLQVNSPAGRPAPTGAEWKFGDGATGTGLLTSHAWSSAGTFQINVTATFPGGRTAVASASIDITESPVLTVQPPAGGTVTGGSINCAPACSQTAEPGETITLTAQPAAGFQMGGWGGACTGTAPTCAVRMDGNKTVSVQFKRETLELIPRAPAAAWETGAGPIPWGGTSDHNGGPDADSRGFALLRPAGSFALEDGTGPEFLETHPQWVNNGWIHGDFTLPAPVIAGDHFRAKIGFMAVANPPSAGEADFVVLAVFADGSTRELSRTHDLGRDGVMHLLDVDLTPAAGATKIRLQAEATGVADQDWCSWVNPRIEG